MGRGNEYAEPAVFEHLEAHLGELEDAERAVLEQAEEVIKIAHFAGQPVVEADTWATLGLSRIELEQPSCRIRQELVFTCYREFKDWRPADILHVVASDVGLNAKALLRGDVLGPAGPLFDQASALEALYCAAPAAYFPDDFAEFGGTRPTTAFVWLVPLTVNEARFVREHGWSRFEDLLKDVDPDLLDLLRSSAV
jgi:Suppressor of fused protein (SUFU)